MRRNVKTHVRREHVRTVVVLHAAALLCPKSGMCGPVAGLWTPSEQSCVGGYRASTPGHYRTTAGSRNHTDQRDVFDVPSVRPGQRSGWDRQSQVCEREPCQHFTRRTWKQRIFTTWWSFIAFGGKQHFKWWWSEQFAVFNSAILSIKQVFRMSFRIMFKPRNKYT